MLDSKLVDYIPNCPKCNIPLGNIVDCGMIEIKEVKKKSTSHVNRGLKFEKLIQNKCNEKVQYCETELGEKETRIVFSSRDIKKIKEESKDNIKGSEE